MSVSAVDGTLEAVDLRRKTRQLSVYNSLIFRLADGGEMRLAKAVVANQVAAALEPGTRGRFYLYKSIDQKGIHGVRAADGTSVHVFPRVNERLMLMVLIINAILLVGRILIDGSLWLLPLGLVVMGAIVYPLYRKTRVESERQFHGDSGYAAGPGGEAVAAAG